MVLPEFEYRSPKSLEEASEILQSYQGKAMIMAGGTDTINPLKDHALDDDFAKPECIVDIKNIPGLDQIEYDPEQGLRIGALVKLPDIEFSPIVREYYPSLAEAAHVIASTQIRGKGTMVGNMCNASPSADSVPSLIVLDAVVQIYGPEGTREVPVEKFFTGFKKLDLAVGEIVTGLAIPPLAANQRAAYIKHAFRKAMDLAIVGVAAKLTVEDGICKDAKVALGAVAITAVRSPKAEAVLIGSKLTEEDLEQAGKAAMEDCAPISDVRASAEYRRDMVRVFTKRSVRKALEQFQEGE